MKEAQLTSIEPVRKSRRGLRAGGAALALLFTGCTTTLDGGGVVANTCIPARADYDMKEGDELIVGVGDLSINGNNVTNDHLALKLRNGQLEVKAEKGGQNEAEDESAVLTIPTQGASPDYVFEENGSQMAISLKPKGGEGRQVVHLEKTCPPPADQK